MAISHTIIAGAVLFLLGLGAGFQAEHWRVKANKVDQLEEVQRKYVGAVERSEAAAVLLQTGLDRLDKKKTILTKEIQREVQKVEYRCPLPPGGRVLYERASQGDATVTRDLPNGLRLPGTLGGK